MRAAWKRTWTLDAAPGAGDAGGATRLLARPRSRRSPRRRWRSCPSARARCCGASRSSSPSCRPRRTSTRGLDPRALGLFSGTAYADGATALGGQPGLTQIVLFRRNLERVGRATRTSCARRSATTLLHETGHFFGLDDAALEELGPRAEVGRRLDNRRGAHHDARPNETKESDVANIKSSEKANRQRVKRTARNVAAEDGDAHGDQEAPRGDRREERQGRQGRCSRARSARSTRRPRRASSSGAPPRARSRA